MANELMQKTIDDSINSLLKHSKNKERFRKNSHMISTGIEDSRDYTNKSLRRSRSSRKSFINAIFNSSAAAGSNFVSCSFERCNFKNANFQECNFIDCKIFNSTDNNSIVFSNFNETLFSDEFVMNNLSFEHSVFYNSAFIDGEINNTTFYSCTLEGALFSNVAFNTVRFTDLNIDYAIFENVVMNDVVLPFSQICYTFGLLDYLKSTKDEVYITSVSNQNGYISKDEYLELIPDFINYYTETKDFFPLANIYLFQGEYDKAKNTIKAGILTGVAECDFRRIKYLCKLISEYGVFGYHDRKEIYDYIYSHISFYNMHPSLLYNYNTYKKEIESYLLSNQGNNYITATIDIETDVFPEDSKKIGILLSTLEEIITSNKSLTGEHSILCRHNSAEELRIVIDEIWSNLLIIVPSIYAILLGVMTLEEKRLSIKKDRLEIATQSEKNVLEIEKLRLKNEKDRIELQNIYAQQLKDQNKIRNEILRDGIVNNDIGIKSVRHNMIGNIPPHVVRELVEYNAHRS